MNQINGPTMTGGLAGILLDNVLGTFIQDDACNVLVGNHAAKIAMY
jgi:hypothetical protein|tara:strand:+ start:137 stop:274 length:138 start_codon:yes stop_codon:yes gene_type:complete